MGMEMTIELSCCKYPLETELQGHWQDNKESLLSYLEAALGGLRGLVTDKNGTAVQGAVITIFGLEEKNVTTSSWGSGGGYWRQADIVFGHLTRSWGVPVLGGLSQWGQLIAGCISELI